MKIKGNIVILYGILLGVGGLIGHLVAQSIYSLIAGSISAIIAIICGVGMRSECRFSKISASILSLALTLFFIYRFMLTYRFMPSGMMAVISLAVFLMLIFTKKNSLVRKEGADF
jgi:uncharacterized membrane protein (UPF0136 family)